MFINDFEPVAFNILSLEIRWYSLSYIFGIVFGWFYCKKKLIKNDDLIIFSSVLGNDFYRDTMSYRSGFPRAYIRKNNDQSLSFSKPPPKDLIGSKFYKSQNSSHKYNFLYSSVEKSWFLHALGITNIEFFNKYKRMIINIKMLRKRLII